MIRTHLENKAAVTIAALPVAEQRGHVVRHHENPGRWPGASTSRRSPRRRRSSSRVRTDPSWLERLGLKAAGRPYLASMGIYLFNRSCWSTCCKSSNATDFGHELLPQTIADHRVQAHLFDGYWEDIGTVGAFHKANIDLTGENPPFDFASEAGPIFTRPRFLPCSRIAGATVKNSLICDGTVIGRGSVIENSVIGVRARIADNVTIRDTATSWGSMSSKTANSQAENQRLGRPAFGIGDQFGHRAGDHRQERPHRPQCQGHQPARDRRIRKSTRPT